MRMLEVIDMPTSSFGPFASAYAARFQTEFDAVMFDDAGLAEALVDAFERAYRNESFFTMPLIGDRRARVALDAARTIVASDRPYWKRRANLDLVRAESFAFEGRSQIERCALSQKERDSIGDVLLTGEAVVVRSWTELMRLTQLLDVRPRRTQRAIAPPQRSVPRFEPRSGAKTIVVWAPTLDSLSASLVALALHELRVPVVVICREATAAADCGLRADFVDVADTDVVAALWRETAALIDLDPDDPAAAVALASLGLPLAASFGSGAHEYVDGLYLYDLWDYRSILHAALAALGGEPPTPRAPIPAPSDLVSTQHVYQEGVGGDPPLVSVIVPTLNRHGVLPRAIDSIARQTYPNVEVIVVNDGGKPVDSIVERLPRYTLIDNERPQGASRAAMIALRQAAGTYIVFLADDDYLFPSHISLMVYALERTGESVAIGMCAESYLTPNDDGSYDFIGTSIRAYRSSDPTVLRTVPASIAISAMTVRHDAAIAVGDFDERMPIYEDYEWHLRFLDRYDFVWISQLVTNMDSRLDRSNASSEASSSDRTQDLERVWILHAYPDRPDIDAARTAYLSLGRGAAPPWAHPLYRGVTRLAKPKRSVYRLT